jgi:4-amino-4-deoxy-L-arabinose transferase-like glycosyltransferase
MGKTDTLALEFPLPEAIVAVSYQILGESIPLARLVFLLFFIGAVYYFHKINVVLFGSYLARIATIVYLALPLSIYYSRAIHIDFSVLFFVHSMVYYFIIGVQRRSTKPIFISVLAACFAFTIKAPYAFYWAIPMLWFALHQKALGWIFRFLGLYLLSIACFYLWQRQVAFVNSQSPNLDYILHYHKMVDNTGWYFGSWQQRFSPYPWWVLLQRSVLEVAGLGGIIMFVLGWIKIRELPHFQFLLYWFGGLIVYIMIFFNLNFIHNYYQIPLLAPCAIIIARGIQWLGSHHLHWAWISLGFLGVVNVGYSEASYFVKQPLYEEVGSLIKANTPDSSLVIITFETMDCRNPQILYRARRRGWSIEEAALKPEVIQRLKREQGAHFWAYAGADLPTSIIQADILRLADPQGFELNVPGIKLYLFDLGD